MECEHEGCDSEAALELHIPWKENELVCAGHGRVRAQEEGVVAEPMDNADDNLLAG